MAGTIFFSWQSDRPAKVTRTVIKLAIEAAIEELNAEIEEADRPSDERLEIDHDTKGLPGSPDIAASILAKIEAASVFVADVTPIGLSNPEQGKRQKHLPNPNVLIELGYAKKALTTDRIVQVWNTAFTNCGPDDLPFDMRGKRGPISFALPADADKRQRDEAVKNLTNTFTSAFKPILELAQSAVVAPDRWADADGADPSIWPTDSGKMLVNEPAHGSGTKQIFPPPRSFVRILPARWKGSDNVDRYDMLIDGGSRSAGATKGGVLTYPGSVLFDDTRKVHAITKRFARTGELWGTRTDLIKKHDGRPFIFGDKVPMGWARFLGSAVPHIANGGGTFPFGIRLGVFGIQDTHWPMGESLVFGAPHAALESSLALSYELSDGDLETVWKIVVDAWKKYREVFSIPEPGMSDLQQMKDSFRSCMQ